jgi:cytochrome P450
MTTDDAFAAGRELFEFDPDRTACPYPTFAALRDCAPVAWFDAVESFVVTRYDLILEVLRQPETFSSRSATGPATERQMMTLMIELAMEDPEIAALAERSMASGTMVPVLLQADPPEHGRQRKLVNRAFSPASIRAIEAEIQRVSDDLIDRFADRGRVELLTDFAVPLPMTVIAQALGVSLDRMDDFMRWSKTMVAGIGKLDFGKAELAGIVRAQAELSDYLLGVIDEREREPRDDLISQIVQSTIDGERLTRPEIISMVVQFLLAGNDTTAKLIATGMLRLANDPALADRLRADPELVGPFVEELLRLEPPINGIYRTADVDYELGGVEIPAGKSVWLVYAAGNRDPEQFPEPDALQCPHPSKTPHLAFGFGEHFCLGASLARAESRIGIQSLLARCADVRLDVDPAEVPYEVSFMLHGLQRLPLAFRAASAASSGA